MAILTAYHVLKRQRSAAACVSLALVFGAISAAYGFGPTTMRTVPRGGVLSTLGPAVWPAAPPNVCDIALKIAAAGELAVILPNCSNSSFVSARTTTPIPIGSPPAAIWDGWFASRGMSFRGTGIGSEACHPAFRNRSRNWSANRNASPFSFGNIISIGALGLPSKAFINLSLSIWRGPICLRSRAVSLFNSAIFRSFADSNIFLYGAPSLSAANSIASARTTPKNAHLSISSQSQTHHATLIDPRFYVYFRQASKTDSCGGGRR
jgi:hypothetical protein